MSDEIEWWMAILAPRRASPVLNAVPRALDDRRLTACLMMGRLHFADESLRAAGHGGGMRQLFDGQIVGPYPVSSVIAALVDQAHAGEMGGWASSLLGERRDVPSPVVGLWSAIAFATDDDLSASIEVVDRYRRRADGLSWLVLSVQLAARLHEVGRYEQAARTADDVVERHDRSRDLLGRSMVDRARWIRWSAELRTDEGTQDRLTDLQRRSSTAVALESDVQASSGGRHLAERALRAAYLNVTGPGWSSQTWDDGYERHVAAWLLSECWGAPNDGRHGLASYVLVNDAFDLPENWDRVRADATYLDLLRRAGADQEVGAVASRWWESGPLDNLVTAVHLVRSNRLNSNNKGASLTLLRVAGDLLDASSAAQWVTELCDRATGADFSTQYDVVRTLPGILPATERASYRRAAELVRALLNSDFQSYVLIPLMEALDAELVGSELLAALVDDTSKLIASDLDDVGAEGLRIEALLLASLDPALREDAERQLLHRFQERPSTPVAAGLLRLPKGAERFGSLLEDGLIRLATEGVRGRWSPYQLLALIADRPQPAKAVREHLENPAIALTAKAPVLEQLTTTEHATSLLSSTAAAVIRQQTVDPRHTLDSIAEWVWMGAIASAGRIGESELVDWLWAHTGGKRMERWDAAKVLGAAGGTIPRSEAEASWKALVHDANAQVAWAASSATWTLMDPHESNSRQTAHRVSRQLVARDGCLGPLAAIQILAPVGGAHEWRSFLDNHPSAVVRRAIAQTELSP